MSEQAQARMRAPDIEQLLQENQELRRRAEEAEEILRALRSGEADAILVTSDREQVYVLGTADDSYRLMIEHLPYSAATLTVEGAVIQINTSFVDMLKLPPESLVGKPIGDFIAPDSVPDMRALMSEGLQGNAKREIIFQRGDGALVPVYLCAKLTKEGARGAGLVITDLTEQRHYERLLETQEALRASEERLRSADKKKDEFIATLAHELRNPLGAITYAAALIGKSGITDSTVKCGSDVIERQVSHMTRLLNDLLDVGRISTGKIKLDMRPIGLASVLDAALEASRPIIERHHHSFEVISPSEPVLLTGDAERLAQVFTNLLNNSAKYTDPDGNLCLTATKQAQEVIVSVRDDGVGIAPEKLPHVFDLFYQAEEGLERTSDGLGIGLSLAKRLVEMHGGTIEAFSDGLGRGSEFVVRLPAS